jgi:hypothetical protein
LANGEFQEAKIIKKLRNIEMKKHDWEKIRKTFNPRPRSGLSNIEIPFQDKNEKKQPTRTQPYRGDASQTQTISKPI